MRLQKYLAMNGIASRRKCEEYIASGLVAVNGRIVTEMGTQVDPDKDEVTFRGNTVKKKQRKVTIMLHKPIGVLSTASDEFNRPTVVELVGHEERLYPVGRLDYLTSGLLLLSNDGDLALHLTHPSHQKEKVYHAWVFGIMTEEKMNDMKKGLKVDDYVTSPARIKMLVKEKDRCLLEIGLREGRNRQVRKMCEVLGYPVISLKRVSIGGLTLGALNPGEWRLLTDREIQFLMSEEGELS